LSVPSQWSSLGGCSRRLGRDVLSRVIYAARIDLEMGVLAVVPPFTIGCLIGVAAGAAGGILGALVDCVTDILEAFPRVVLVLAVMAALGADLGSFFTALALVAWPGYARLTREEWRRMKKSAFVATAWGLGFGAPRIYLQHILPNTLTPAIACALSDTVRILLLALSIGYFGIGAPAASVEWGSMIAEGQALLPEAWWICLFPGLAAVLLALGLTWLADGAAARLQARS